MDQSQILLEMTEKLDALTTQVQGLAEFADDQRRRQREWDDLKMDLTPVVNDLYLVAVEQLNEIEPHVQLEDLLYLLKRLARNTQNIERLLDQAESLSDLMQMYVAGKLNPHISDTLPLERAQEPLDLLAARKSTGKVVVTP